MNIEDNSITWDQFIEEMLSPTIPDTEPIKAQPIKNIEPFRNNGLAKHRIRVSFDFDVTCDDGAILNSGNDEDVKAHDLALLKSLLQTPQLIDILVDMIGTELGLNGCETFMARFLPQVSTNCHYLFSDAIDRLSGENATYWRDIRDAPKVRHESLLSMCAEHIFECFGAKFVNSSYEVIDP